MSSFLESMNEMEAFTDIALAHSHDPIASMTSAAYRQASDTAAQHNQKYISLLVMSYDTNVCTATKGKYLNITRACKEMHPSLNY